MTPKEKAEELFDKMYSVKDMMGNYPMCFDTAKQCALIAVDLIIYHTEEDSSNIPLYEFCLEVKQEIEKL